MGAKISVDSATMMNKGLEYIEAMRLFRVTPEQIHILIHPESVVHSMVELVDGAVIAQMGVPDMDLPIQYALTWPERLPSGTGTLDLAAAGTLRFEEPDLDKLPCLRLALGAAKTGGTAPCVLSAANEAAVALFLKKAVGYHDIPRLVEAALESVPFRAKPSLEELLEADALARSVVMKEGS
jgi:1-deoxy-D-xylulose-5-phosphate reductoisomerase